MIAVADNLNARNSLYMEALDRKDRETVADLARKITGAGLDAAIVDILDDSVKGAIYLIKSFRDEIVFSGADLM